MNNQKLGKFLPIGTVVLLKGAKKRLMITGFCSMDESKKDKVYDYMGCMFPEGIINSKEMALFDHSQIEKIFYLGCSDAEEKKFKQELIKNIKELVNKQENK